MKNGGCVCRGRRVVKNGGCVYRGERVVKQHNVKFSHIRRVNVPIP